jgi:hypothetical protein
VLCFLWTEEVTMMAVVKREGSDRVFVAVIWSVIGVVLATLTVWVALGGQVEQLFD